MELLIEYRDFIIAVAAFGLGIINTIHDVQQSRLAISVSLEASIEDGKPVIKVVNHSRFDITVADVGLIDDAGETHPSWWLNNGPPDHDTPFRLESMAHYYVPISPSFKQLKQRFQFQPYASTSTGKRVKGKDSRPFFQRLTQRAKCRWLARFKPNPFSEL